MQGEGGSALQVFEREEDGRGECCTSAEASSHGKVCDDRNRGEDDEIKDADAKCAETADDAEQIIGDEAAGHLKVEEVFVGRLPILHQEGFVEERSFVVRDGPLK